ncbi:MAG: EI24 domain-containing protein [Deltaproteobacteria bacterium]|nr:EI24 domain-containing protein [Deltaproteobacteria bacterium]
MGEHRGAAGVAVGRGASLRDAAGGVALHLEALRMLWRERALWALAAVPALIGVAAVAAAVSLLVYFGADLWGLATSWIPSLSASAWYQWAWIGPVRALLMLLGVMVLLAFSGLAVLVAWLAAGVVAAPFLDVLSRRVEALVTGEVLDRSDPGLAGVLREAGRAVLQELRRLAFFLSVQALILLLALLIPGGQLLAAPAMLAFTVLFLPLDYASYALDRRRVDFSARRRWVLAHRAPMVGFGVAAFATFAIPGLNFLAMPVLVVSGTLLALRTPLAEESGSA